MIQNELEVFGFYLSRHPVTEYRIRYNTIELSSVSDYFDKFIDVVVLVDKIRNIKTKNNEMMCFITGSDELTNIDVVLFPRVYESYTNIKVGDILKINGRIEKRFDQYQLVVNNIENIEN